MIIVDRSHQLAVAPAVRRWLLSGKPDVGAASTRREAAL